MPPRPQFALHLEKLEQYLVPGSLLYLALPYVIFCFGWLRWYWALAVVGLLAVALVEATRLVTRATSRHSASLASVDSTSSDDPARSLAENETGDSPHLTLRHLTFLLALSLVWLLIVGVSEIGYVRGDWVKHESVLKDLIEGEWPLLYNFYESPLPLVYYLAFYLPAALVGKLGSWGMVQAAIFLWTFTGVVLSMLWFWVLVFKSSSASAYKATYGVFLIFIFFSGLDLIGNIIANQAGWTSDNWGRLERWSSVLEYSATTIALAWVPNQALSGWIAGGLTIYGILYLRYRRITWFPVGLSALWTPFVALGLAPYLLAEILSDKGPLLARFRRYLSWSNLAGVILALVVGLFYLSKFYESSPYVRSEIPHGFLFPIGLGSPFNDISLYVTFWFLEVAIYGFLLWRSMKWEDRLWRWLFGTTFVFLTLLPLYAMGIYNDLAMRASIPALFLLAVFVARAVYHRGLSASIRVSLVIALVIGASTALVEFRHHSIGLYRMAAGVPEEDPYGTRGILELYTAMPKFLHQYVGSYQSPFFQYLAKEQEWNGNTADLDLIAFSENRILFEAYEIEKETALQPGDEVKLVSRLHVFFDAIDKNYNISLRLIGEDGREIWKEQGWPENRPTSIWAPSVLWFDTRMVKIPLDTPPGIYRFDLSFVDPDTHELLPAIAMPEQAYLGEMVSIGYVTVGEIVREPAYRFPAPAELDGKVALLGMTPAPNHDSLVAFRGEPLNVELFWQARAEMEDAYTGFVHLLDAEGKLVAQHDHPPRNGFLPTDIWREGLIVDDGYTLQVPQDAAPGTYSLVAGMYDLESGVRLSVRQADKQDRETVKDSIWISHVDVR